jgi:uncharacterized protein with HEPN domain
MKDIDKKSFLFEILCVEPQDNDIQSEKAMIKALAYSSKLWSGNEVIEVNTQNVYGISDTKSGISLFLKTLDTSKMLTAYSETAYILYIEGTQFESLETFRLRLLRHLKSTLNFLHIRILTDDISTNIANNLYPKINAVESSLRRYLTKFFIQRVGINWWESTATRSMIEKIKVRGEKSEEYSDLIDEDVSLVDFDDLGELIYKQTSGFNQPEKIIDKLIDIKSFEELKIFQNELQGNYTKYFKEFFQDKYFEQRWKELYRIRNKVAHQRTFYQYDLDRGVEVSDSLLSIIAEAESKIDEIVFSIGEKEAIKKATMDAQYDFVGTQLEKDMEDSSDITFRGGLKGLKVLGKITVPMRDRYITENVIISELEDATDKKYTYFIGLKWFVTTFLKDKGYVVATSYSVLNIMIDKGEIEIYNIKAPEGYDVKAIRIPTTLQ